MDELLTCSVCCERYSDEERQPVVLPRCGHTFCRPCVTLLLAANLIICPTCRTEQRIESAHRLPTEYTLLAIIAAQDNAKLDNCRRHEVKLSFWCKTCGMAVCGECLFEDHPTHTCEVVRALTYIRGIKESVQEVGCRFMEALDTREQSYYRMVYTCAKKIDEALRNVTVLRKDMGEARDLMKGVKVDECNMSLSTATSLAEAAKYLGLKWNIQDANFNRNQQKDEAKVEKKQEQEEEEKKKEEETEKKELSPEEEKERRKERIRERKRKRLQAEKEKLEKEKLEKEKLEKAASTSEIKTTEAAVEALSSLQVSADAESIQEPKKKGFGIRKSKTMAVFEPLSMDKEIMVIKEKIIELDNKERERLEKEALRKIEEEEQEEQDKKTLEQKAIEAEREAEAAVEAVRALVAAKEKELKQQIENEALLARKRTAEQEAERKAAQEELEKLNAMLKKPRGRMARQFLVDAEKEDAESSKLLSDVKDATEDKEEKTKAEEGDSGEEKTNGGAEHANKEEQASGSEDKTYVGEMSPEEKEAKHLAEEQQKEEEAGKLFDFMKEPLFTVCVEGAEGRLALAQWEPKGIHIYCHQFQQLHYDIVIKSNVLQALISSKNPIVFLELSVGTSRPTRVYIKLWGHLRRAHNFLALCLGDQGSALLNTKLLQVYNLNEPGERILGGDHEYNCGRGGCALLSDLEWNGDYAMPMAEGLLTAAGSGQHATNSLFLICTRSDADRNFSCPFGEVVEGLEDIRDAIAKSAAEQEEIWITECGVVLEPPRL